MLQTGTIFSATDKMGCTYTYRFQGVILGDSTGCSYIQLENLTIGGMTAVEYSWFRERKIQIVF